MHIYVNPLTVNSREFLMHFVFLCSLYGEEMSTHLFQTWWFRNERRVLLRCKPHKSYWNLWPSAKSEVELVMHRTLVPTRGRWRCVPSQACRGSYENKFIYRDGMSYVSERAYYEMLKLIFEVEKLHECQDENNTMYFYL